jgi:serine protease AprX
MSRNSGGNRGETRSSALWGTGNRGSDSRSNALWGRGTRGLVTAITATLVLGVPLASTAGVGSKSGRQFIRHVGTGHRHTYVSPGLLRLGAKFPHRRIHVIIQSDDSTPAAAAAFARVTGEDGDIANEHLGRRLGLIGGVSAVIDANNLAALAKIPGLTVTPDAQVRLAAYSSKQLWPYESGVARNWDTTTNNSLPTIAVVDSGIDANRSDFGGRVVANVNLTTRTPNSPGDGRGHGTFVAGIAAGGAADYAGAAPNAKLVSIDVMDDNGVASTSDVIAACKWILANKDKYNIKVANFSLHSSNPSNFTRDPLDQAVEQLWFKGVVVVAAAGNYGLPNGPSGVKFAPGNDPFVITVGAIDIGGTKNAKDDYPAPWSAYGRTYDGFAKPDLVAPGRYMVGPVPPSSTLAIERPTQVVAPGYMQLSGTSFAAPVVAGAAAQILSRHPSFTPDQVKGALMLSAKPVDGSAPLSVGVGEIQAAPAPSVNNPPNPNKALDGFLTTDPVTGNTAFNAVSWLQTAKTDVSWDAVSYDATSWAGVSWDLASWATVSYDAVSYSDVSYDAVSYADVSSLDVSYEDAAEGDTGGGDGYTLDATQLADIAADPTLAPPPDVLNAAASAAGVTTP